MGLIHTAAASHGALQLFLSGRLQFSSADERRYHEALVHPVLAATPGPTHVFIGGAGNALAVREVLKWRSVQSVTIVDIDPAMTRLAAASPQLSLLNEHALDNPKVRIISETQNPGLLTGGGVNPRS